MRAPRRQRGGPWNADGREGLDEQRAAEALCQAIEYDHGALVCHGDAANLVRALGGNPNLGNLSPGGTALYLIALLLAARV